MTNKTLISVVGPTAIGKTSLAISLAKHFNTEIVSADSRQFFKEMSIGTAVPSTEELEAASHHFIQHKSIFEPYSVGDFERDALQRLTLLFQKNDIVIMVGGSGLYVDAVTKGLDKFPETDESIRTNLNKQFQAEGIEALKTQLKTLDPDYYKKVDTANPHRLIRALEVCISSGKPYSSFLNQEKPERPFKTFTVGITADREIIYNRINQRVDLMMESGLLEEVKSLENHKNLNALQTVGYKELFNYLNKEWILEFSISEIKKNTRRFAKRQLTWFKKNKETLWIPYNQSATKTIQVILKELHKKSV